MHLFGSTTPIAFGHLSSLAYTNFNRLEGPSTVHPLLSNTMLRLGRIMRLKTNPLRLVSHRLSRARSVQEKK